MRFTITFVLAFLSFVPTLPAFPQQSAPPTVQRDPQAVAILQRSLAAMGGNNLPQVADLTLSGQIIRQRAQDKATGTILLEMTAPEVVRVEMNSPDESTVHIVNGGRMRQIRGVEDHPMPFHGTLNHPFQYVPLLSTSLAMADANLAVLFIGEEAIDGNPVYHVRTEKVFAQLSEDHAKVMAKLTGTDFFIDKGTALLLRRTQELPSVLSAKITLPIEFRYSDYQPLQGILIPHTVVIYVGGQQSNEIHFTSAALNTNIRPTEFEVKP